MTPAGLFAQGAALTSSLLGYVLIIRAGAFGSGQTISLGEGFAVLSIAAVFGYWLAPIFALPTSPRGALLALVIVDVLWVVLAQGLTGFAFCAIPICPDFAPFGDLARYGSVIVGVAAAWAAWRAYRAASGPVWWGPVVTMTGLIVLSFILQSVNATFPAS